MSTSRVSAPAGVEVTPRAMGFGFSGKNIPRHWFDGDAWTTQLFNALSMTFPRGEQMFIDSVRAYRDEITDPDLAEAVRGFIAQEAHHRKEHDHFNRWLGAQGLPFESVDAFVERRSKEGEHLPKIVKLAVTCALEHFTAIMADAFLNDAEFLAHAHDDVRWLWVWHAIEETEHKAVAFDVFEAVGGDYRTRAMTMFFVTPRFIRDVSMIHLELIRADGSLTDVRSAAKTLLRFWGPRGHFTKLIPAYLGYYRRDFHPWQHDNSKAIAHWKAEVEKRAKRIDRPHERDSGAASPHGV